MKRRTRDPLERLRSKIIDYGDGGCTGWTNAVDKNGYPRFWYKDRSPPASRVLWTLVNGPIPTELFVRHACDNPTCLRLEHLLLGTPKDNTQDAVARDRMRGARKVTAKLAAKINTLHGQGVSIKAIAARLQLSRSTIGTYLDPAVKRKGAFVRGKRHRLWTDGHAVREARRAKERAAKYF